MSDKAGESNTSASEPYLGTRARSRASKHTDTYMEPIAGSSSQMKTSTESSSEPSSGSAEKRKKVKARRQSSSKSNIEPASAINPAATNVAPVTTAVKAITSRSSLPFPGDLCHIDLTHLGQAKKYVPTPYAERYVENFIKRSEARAAAEAAKKLESTASTTASSCATSIASTNKTVIAGTSSVAATRTSTEATTSTAEATTTSKAAATTSAGASHNKNAGAGRPYRTTWNTKKSKDRPEHMHIMDYLAQLHSENASNDVLRLEVSNYFYGYHMKNINKPTPGFPLSKADIFRNTLQYNSARGYALQMYQLEESIEYEEMKEAGLIDRTIPGSVLDEEYPSTSDEEKSCESWSDVVAEIRQKEGQKKFEEMNAPRFGIERETDNESEVEEDVGYFGA